MSSRVHPLGTTAQMAGWDLIMIDAVAFVDLSQSFVDLGQDLSEQQIRQITFPVTCLTYLG
jgi:hypothetical protein